MPFDNILGSPEVVQRTETTGFKGAMATFDATRPIVAASAIGLARATLELLKEKLAEQGVTVRYGLPRQKLTNLEREVIDMEIMLRSAWLLIIKAVWMADNSKPNALEASMSKVRAGDVVTRITQKAVEIMGTLGYTTDTLLEKWFRDAKINDLYEGTRQINRAGGGAPDLGVYTNTLFAVVHRGESPGGRSVALLDDLFLAMDTAIVDRIIEQDGDRARYIAGLVAWQPGELVHEVKSGFWYVIEPDADLVFLKSTDGLWEELVRRSGSGV